MNSAISMPRSVCILRLSALGDATHVLPVINAIRDHSPETRITWIIGSLEHKLVKDLPAVEFLVFNKRAGWKEVARLRRLLKGREFDVLLHMQVAARANLLSRLIRAPLRIGWDRARCRDFHQWFINTPVAAVHQQHQVEGFLEFSRALGIQTTSPRWDLPVSEQAQQWVEQHIDSSRPTVVISPCSSHTLRNWSAERYAQIADYAVTELGLQVVLSGGPAALEQEMAAAIESGMTASCTNLVGKDTLEQSKALLRQADLLISPDSGPAHIASALGTDVLGLYAATWSRRSGPYNSLDLCVDRFSEAALQFRKKTADQLRWGSRIEVPGVMDLIRVSDVQSMLQSWWQNKSSGTAATPRP